ncbi:hypothetical protein MNBD_BACTEROID06-1751, partial [hydrothermal vent metagenome]
NSLKKRFNAAPTQPLPIITSTNTSVIKFYNWGAEPNSSKNKRITSKLINAPLKQLTEKIFYKNALNNRRCLVIADGFYVWKSIAKKRQIPYRITLQDERLFAMAGLWETYENIDGIKIGTFSIITQPATVNITNLTSDLPIILHADLESKWLQNTNSIDENFSILSQPSPLELKSYAVSPLLNNLANDSQNLILPAPPSDQFGNYSLFD